MTPDDYAEQAARMLSEANNWGDIGGQSQRLGYESAAMLLSAVHDALSWREGRAQVFAFEERIFAPPGRWFELTQDSDGNIYINGERRDG